MINFSLGKFETRYKLHKIHDLSTPSNHRVISNPLHYCTPHLYIEGTHNQLTLPLQYGGVNKRMPADSVFLQTDFPRYKNNGSQPAARSYKFHPNAPVTRRRRRTHKKSSGTEPDPILQDTRGEKTDSDSNCNCRSGGKVSRRLELQ